MAYVPNNFFRKFNSNIEQPVRQHLINVYGCLTLSAISAAVGSFVHIYLNIFSSGFLSTLVGLGLMIALLATPHNGKNTSLRFGYLLGFAFFTGMGLGPLIQYVIKINPNIILTALMGTSVVFACFTLSALFSRRGYWLFLMGPLSTLGTTMFFLSLANIFLSSRWLYQMEVYLALMATCGFVVFDTTLIMEKFRMGDKDFISHSVALFVDFIDIFQKLLVILTNKERYERERKRN